MSAAVVLETFTCVPLFEVKLTRSACGARYQRATKEAGKGGQGWKGGLVGQDHLVGPERCAGCPVGAAHLAGELPEAWPDGAPIERSTLTPAAGPEPGRARWTGGATDGPQPGAEPPRAEPASTTSTTMTTKEAKVGRAKKPITKTCPECERTFKTRHGPQKYCSKDCGTALAKTLGRDLPYPEANA